MKNMSRIPLKKLEDQSEKRKKPFLVTDIETASWTKFVVGGVYDGIKIKFHKTVESLIDDCLEREGDCFAHFGGRFDFLFFIREALRNSKYEISNLVPRGSGILSFDLSDDTRTVTFRDSSALLPFSLRRLTESFRVDHKKQEIDYSKISEITSELLEYLKYDLKGLYEVLEKFYSWPLIEKAGRSVTLAGQAIRVWRSMLPYDRIHSLSKTMDSKIRPSYFGGRVEIFKPLYRGRKPLFCFDINSLYPYCMRSFDFPTDFKAKVFQYKEGDLGFYECEVEMPKIKIPPLGAIHPKSGKLVFPVGKFNGMYTSAEIEYAKTFGAKIKIRKGYLFKNGGPIFREFVDTLYTIRKSSRTDSVDSTIAKLLLNSCYGRTGIRSEKENIVFDDGSLGLRPLRELQVGEKTYRLMTKEIEIETFSHVGIASFVTSYGRITTHKKIMEAPNEIYYTDTDSLYTTHEYPTGEGLGELKCESKTYSACFLLPKTYIAGKKVAMKGFDKKKISHFTQEDFEACLEGDLKRLRIIQEPKFATFKTALRQGEVVCMTKSSPKQIRSRYDKREIYKTSKGYDTRALEIR